MSEDSVSSHKACIDFFFKNFVKKFLLRVIDKAETHKKNLMNLC